MKVDVVFAAGGRVDFCTEIHGLITQGLINHPFLACPRIAVPCYVLVKLNIVEAHLLSAPNIDHNSFLRDRSITLSFPKVSDDDGLYTHLSGNPISINPRAKKLIAHEMAHFVDARLDQSFGYNDAARPSDPALRSIVYHLWDSYIDGRLGPLAPYNLQCRQHWAASRVPSLLVERAWNAAFTTYRDLLQAANDASRRQN